MRTAPNNSANAGAPADFPSLRDKIDNWKKLLAQTDWAPWMIIGLAAFLRFFLLAIKPPHFDEGINGWFVDAHIVKEGFYRYDPTNYHGPLHFYVLFVFQTLFGRNLWALRLPVVIVSTLCVWFCFKFEPFVGRTAARLAALAMAVSPGFVFYGRYSIHEVWLVLFTMMFILGFFGLWKSGTANYLWSAGLGLAGMILTKETYIIHLGSAVIAMGVCYFTNSLSRMPEVRPAKQTWSIVDLAIVIGVGVAVIVFFYSGTFFNWHGVTDIFNAYAAWFKTGYAGQSGHEKPFYYWLKLMAPSGQISRADCLGYELPGLVGLVLCIFCLRFKNFSLRYLAIYGVGTLMAYSIVRYKTPWCVINVAWPFLFIFGAIMLAIPQAYRDRYRRPVNILYAALLSLSLGSTVWLNYFHCTTETEPYVYVQTYNDIYKLTRPVLKLARQDPVFYEIKGHIIRTSAYPLPWMFDDFPHIGYYEHESLPEPLDADFLLVQEDKIEKVEARLKDSYYTEMMTIRSYQEPSKIYFNAKLFKNFFPDRKPEFVGHGKS
jgi:uncharacterized protein (TIGR03663 family)